MRLRLLLCTVFAAAPLLAQSDPVAPPPGDAAPPTSGEASSTVPVATPAPEAPAAAAIPAVVAVPPVPATAEAAPAAAAPAATAESSASKETLSVDFPDEDIRNILRNVADLFELNLVVPDALQGRTSLKLRDVTWRQIFQVVLSPVGYTFLEDGNIIRIVGRDSIATEPIVTKVIPLKVARAEAIQAILRPTLDEAAGERLQVDAVSNSLIIAAGATKIRRLEDEVIKPLDNDNSRDFRQIIIETKFVEVSNRDLKDIGVNWASLQNYRVGAANLGKTYDKGNDQTRTNTSGSNQSQSQTTTSTTTDAGTTTTIVRPSSDGTNQALSLLNTDTLSKTTTAVFSAGEFNVFLSALQSQNNTKLVSNPTLVTTNNKPAALVVGNNEPEPGEVSTDAQSGRQTQGPPVYDQYGISLYVLPQILEVDNKARPGEKVRLIKLDLTGPKENGKPVKAKDGGEVPGLAVKSKIGETPINGNSVPRKSTRGVATEFFLKDGYTMGIGGMIENSTSKGETKVPVLGTLPGIGRLFRSNTASADTRNLLVFITARIYDVTDQKAEQGGSDKYDGVRKVMDPHAMQEMKIQQTDMPGYRDGTDHFYVPPPPEQKKSKKKAAQPVSAPAADTSKPTP